jgi:RNA polymerase sigma-70 factor (ECF subfamily)
MRRVPPVRDASTPATGGDENPPVEPNEDISSLLFERLNSGDPAAIERIVSAYEPHLRMVVRRQIPPKLRAKFDSVDVVQSVWASILKSIHEENLQFTDESHLRAFLIRLALFRFIDLCRQHRMALGRERPLAELDAEARRTPACDRPSELIKASELMDRLMDLCAPSHRELVRLRAMGLPLAEIAARTGYHEGSIRRIFYDLARRLDALDEAQREGPEPASAGPGS